MDDSLGGGPMGQSQHQQMNRIDISPDNFMMRNTVHGAGGFFEQRKFKVNKKGIDPSVIEKFNPV